MDRSDGFWWSPDSRFLAYEEADLSPVELHYVADPLHPESAPVEFRYPRAGTANANVRLGVVPVGGGETRWVSWDGTTYPYLVRVVGGTARSRSSSRIAPSPKSRFSRSTLAAARPASSGRSATTRGSRLRQWDFPQRLAAAGGFLWASERSGQWQLERRDAGGKLVNAVTPAGFRFDELLDVDLERASVVVSGGRERPRAALWRVPLAGGEPKPLAAAPGLHGARFGEQHAIFAHAYSLADGSAGTDVRDRGGAAIAELPSVAEKPPFVPSVDYLTVGEREFDAARRAPARLRPRAPLSRDRSRNMRGPAREAGDGARRASRSSASAMADRGFIVVTPR